jgi:hypothetical protein
MELTPFWSRVLVMAVVMAVIGVFVWTLRRRRKSRPSALGDILRRLEEERQEEMRKAQMESPAEAGLESQTPAPPG